MILLYFLTCPFIFLTIHILPIEYKMIFLDTLPYLSYLVISIMIYIVIINHIINNNNGRIKINDY